MPDLVLARFGGMDGRRMEVSADQGVLTKAYNCHINDGGEIEKRKALVAISGSLPSAAGATFGLASDGDNLYVFGSHTTSGLTLPTGITYQKLEHPSGSAMTELLDWTLFDGNLYVAAKYADAATYHFYNGSRVTDWFDGKARGAFTIVTGDATTSGNAISAVKVNGIDVLGTIMQYTLSNSEFAKSLAAQIAAYTSSPDYTAVADGASVIIIAAAAGLTINGYAVAVTTTGGVSVGSIVNMANGANNSPGEPGATVLTLGSKLYTPAGTDVHYSATDDATKFNTSADGAGFISPATQSAGAKDPTALGAFLNPQGTTTGQTLLVIARAAIQVWHVENNDDLNTMLQVVEGYGTRAKNANIAFADKHMFLDPKGIFHLNTSNASNAAVVGAVGAPINKELKAYMATLTATQRNAAVVAIEPTEKRLWMAIGSRVYVLSYFPPAQVSLFTPPAPLAWSRYDLDFSISDMAIAGDQLYVRSGTSVYAYGGTTGDVYDACAVTARIAYLDAGVPAGFKNLLGVDFALEGTWVAAVNSHVNDPTVMTTLGTFVDTTFDQDAQAAAGRDTHFAVEMTHNRTQAAVISQIVLHYQLDESA